MLFAVLLSEIAFCKLFYPHYLFYFIPTSLPSFITLGCSLTFINANVITFLHLTYFGDSMEVLKLISS